MIIPNRDPRKHLLAQLQIGVCLVCSMSFAIIIEGEYIPVWKRHAVDRISPAIAKTISGVATFVFIDIVAKVNDVIHRIFPCRVSIGIEKAEWIVRAGIYC